MSRIIANLQYFVGNKSEYPNHDHLVRYHDTTYTVLTLVFVTACLDVSVCCVCGKLASVQYLYELTKEHYLFCPSDVSSRKALECL